MHISIPDCQYFLTIFDKNKKYIHIIDNVDYVFELFVLYGSPQK